MFVYTLFSGPKFPILESLRRLSSYMYNIGLSFLHFRKFISSLNGDKGSFLRAYFLHLLFLKNVVAQ